MKRDVTQVVLALMTLISGVVTTFLVPWLKQRLNAGQRERLAALIRVGVFAAQQLFLSDEGVRKKAYVIQLLEEQGYKTAGQPRTCYIDGAWNQDDPEKWLTVIQIPIE